MRSMESEPEWFKFLGSPKGSGDHAWMFSDVKSIHTAPLVARKPVTIAVGFGSSHPDVTSFDPVYLETLRLISDALNEELGAPDLDEDGFVGANCLNSDFSKLKTVAGWSMNPMSLAPVDNALFVASLGLPGDFRSSRHHEIFDKFARLVLGKWKLTSIKTPKLSTAGSPTWMTSARMKREHALFLLANHPSILAVFRKGDLVELARVARVVFVMNAGRRDQVDLLGKERLVFPLDYALSGGRKGEPIVADKRVFPEMGDRFADFSATRARLFHGGPYPANLYAQVVATGTLHGGMFAQFPATFHCTDIDAMARAIPTSFDIRCSDATEYDRSMATFLIRRLFAIAREFWSGSVIDWIEHLCFSAYFSRPVGLGETDRPVLVGDPFLKKHQVFRGNPSGHGWTSLIAKFMMVFDFLATADDLMHDVLENMEKYLNHETPLYTFNNGDDGMYAGEAPLLKTYADYRFSTTKNPGYFVLKPEDGHVWSGMMIVRRPEGGFHAVRRLTTAFEKILVPERSAGSNFRPRWTIGFIERLTNVNHPLHHKAVEILFRVWRDHASATYGPLMDMINRHHERLAIDTTGWTAIDRMVFDKPELLHYSSITEDDVSPHVLAMLFEKALEPHEVLPFAEAYYSGTIH